MRNLHNAIEGNYLVITKYKNYVMLVSEAAFIECTLALRHFHSLKNVLYHTKTSDWCLTSLFLKEDNSIGRNCKPSIANITKPHTI